MYQPISLYIGMRFSNKYSSKFFDRLIFWMPSIGISLNIFALTVVLSVMNGLENHLKNKILKFIPHVLITEKKGFIDSRNYKFKKNFSDNIESISELISNDVILQSKENIAVVTMFGINTEIQDPLTPYLLDVKIKDLKKDSYDVIIGMQIFRQLHLKIGDIIRIIIPNKIYYTPFGRIPTQRILHVIGTFLSSSEADNYQILMNKTDAANLMNYSKYDITSWRLCLYDPFNLSFLKKFPFYKNIVIKTWKNKKGELFEAIRMEKNITCLLLFLITTISIFNIFNSLSILIIEKTKEIAILQTQGITQFQIMMIFIIKGLQMSFIGITVGVFMSILFLYNMDYILLKINSIFASNILLPTKIFPIQIIKICFYTILITIFSILYPSYYATTLKPAKVLSNE